jgi:hypothetical protein
MKFEGLFNFAAETQLLKYIQTSYSVYWGEIKIVNSVSVGVSFFQLEWNVSVSECVCVYIYIYSTNIIQIQDKLIINYAIQT